MKIFKRNSKNKKIPQYNEEKVSEKSDFTEKIKRNLKKKKKEEGSIYNNNTI